MPKRASTLTKHLASRAPGATPPLRSVPGAPAQFYAPVNNRSFRRVGFPGAAVTNYHHDLDSFHRYSKQMRSPAQSSVWKGVEYEYISQGALRKFGFSLRRVGGKGDQGVDLVGLWTVPKGMSLEEQEREEVRRRYRRDIEEEGGEEGRVEAAQAEEAREAEVEAGKEGLDESEVAEDAEVGVAENEAATSEAAEADEAMEAEEAREVDEAREADDVTEAEVAEAAEAAEAVEAKGQADIASTATHDFQASQEAWNHYRNTHNILPPAARESEEDEERADPDEAELRRDSTDRFMESIQPWLRDRHAANLARSLRIIVQCKLVTRKRPVGPMHIRELEGAFAAAPSGWRSGPVMAILISNRAATQGLRDALVRSRSPMGYMWVDERRGLLKQFVWNVAAEAGPLVGVTVGLKRVGRGKWIEAALMKGGRLCPEVDGQEADGVMEDLRAAWNWEVHRGAARQPVYYADKARVFTQEG